MSEEKKVYVNEAGQFRCVVTEPKYGWFDKSPNGKWCVYLPIEVIEEGFQKEAIGAWRGWLTDKSAEKTIRDLVKAFPDFNGDLDALENGEYSFEGKECEIAFTEETYNGKTMVRTSWLYPVGGGRGVSKEEKKKFIGDINDRAKEIAEEERANISKDDEGSSDDPF